MDNRDDWKEIEENQKRIESNRIAKFGFDIKKHYEKNFNKETMAKRKKIKKLIMLIVIILIIISTMIQFYNIHLESKKSLQDKYICEMNKSFNEDLEYVNEEKIYWRGYGFYTMKLKNIPELEIHTLFHKEDGWATDLTSRYHKYFFDKWDDEAKRKFIIMESYDDWGYENTNMRKWKYYFGTYIEVSNYDEFLVALEDIIRFIEYMNNRYIIINCYIKSEDKLIIPHGTRGESNEQIRKAAILQFQDKNYE